MATEVITQGGTMALSGMAAVGTTRTFGGQVGIAAALPTLLPERSTRLVVTMVTTGGHTERATRVVIGSRFSMGKLATFTTGMAFATTAMKVQTEFARLAVPQ